MLMGTKIKVLREKQKLCQNDLTCNILSRSILSKIENNKMLPSIPQLKYVSKKLSIPIFYFLMDDNIYIDNLCSNNPIKFLYDAGKFLNIIEKYEQFKEDISYDCIFLYFVGMSYFNLELYHSANIVYKKFINMYNASTDTFKYNNVEYYASALNQMFKIELKNLNYNKGQLYLNEALNALKKYEKYDVKIYDVIINNIGSFYCIVHDYNNAVDILESFLKRKNDMVNLMSLCSIHLSLNIAYMGLERYEDSTIHIKKAIWLFNYIDKNFDAFESYVNYLNALRFSHKFSEALKVISELENIINDDNLVNLILVEKIIIYFNLDKFSDAYSMLMKIKINNLRNKSKMDYYFLTGHILFLKGNYNLSYNYFKKCEKYFIKMNYCQDLNVLYKDLNIMQYNAKYESLAKKYSDNIGLKNIIV